MSEPRVFVTRIEGRGEPDMVLFSRYEDGVIIGNYQGMMAIFGEDPKNRVVREFVSDACAAEWVKKQCRTLLGRDDIDFIDRPLERPMVALASMQQVPRTRH